MTFTSNVIFRSTLITVFLIHVIDLNELFICFKIKLIVLRILMSLQLIVYFSVEMNYFKGMIPILKGAFCFWM